MSGPLIQIVAQSRSSNLNLRLKYFNHKISPLDQVMGLDTGLSEQQKTIVFASWFGWALDGYDLVLMLFVISSVNQLFFFSGDPTLSLLATFATYIVALVMRPVGGAVFGNFGDKYGRKKTMVITIIGFSTVTFVTGLLPTLQTVGIVAPILLIILRFVQGLFAGGEWASGSVITMEMVPKKTRGLLSGFVQSGYSFGFVLASFVYGLMLSIYPGHAFIEIGWRIMFFTGIIPGLIALIIRVKMVESKIWLESKEQKKEIHKTPLKNVISDKVQRKRILLALIIMTGLMYSYYSSIGFMPVFLENYVNISKNDVAIIMIVVTVADFNWYCIYRIHKSTYRKDENINCFCICIYNTICTITVRSVRFNKYLRKNVLCFYIDICICNSLWPNTSIPVRKISNRDKKYCIRASL